MTYFRDLWFDTRRMLAERLDLVVISVVGTFALTVTFYHYLKVPGVSAEWRSTLEILARGLVFLVLPLASLLVLRIPLRELGFNWGEPKKWLRDVLLLYLIMLPLLILVSRQPDFRHAYPYFRIARLGLGCLILAQVFQLAFMFCWEFIVRGYLLFGFFRRIGYAAIAVQLIPFVLLHINKPELEAYGSIVAGLVLGVVALRSRSFYPCVLLHFAVAATLDTLAVVRF